MYSWVGRERGRGGEEERDEEGGRGGGGGMGKRGQLIQDTHSYSQHIHSMEL